MLAWRGIFHVSGVNVFNPQIAMDGAEAKSILAKELAEFAARPYDKLVLLIDNPDVKNVGGYSGENYQIEFEVFWDSKPGGNLRIMASIDDGGWRAFMPITDSLIVKPDGTLL
jgi:hypothetical protein